MPKLNVADIERGGVDDMGVRIIQVYGKKPPEYAVYRTRERVVIQFADAPAVTQEQRKAMAVLNPLRGEINGLIDGWRNSFIDICLSYMYWLFPKKAKAAPQAGDTEPPARPANADQRRAERFDRRVGDALIVAFENDVASAQTLLAKIKQDILDERIARARFEYLLVAGLTAALAMLVVHQYFDHWKGAAFELLVAAGAGAVGAFFSIAIAIRSRTVLPDLQRLNNLLDALLRVMIGVIAGAVLIALMRSGAVSLKIGDAELEAATCIAGTAGCKPYPIWLYVMLVGFIAGFSERFVPDLLEKVSSASGENKSDAITPSPSPPNPATPDAQPPNANAPDAPEPQDDDDPTVVADHCHGDELTDAEITADEALPPASGGVASSGGTS